MGLDLQTVIRPPLETVMDLAAGAEILRRRPYGVIEMQGGRLAGVHLRPWPKIVSVAEIFVLGRLFHRRRRGDRCLLYYNQPLSCRGFLAVSYVVSTRDTTLKTFRGATVVLDEIARLKESLAAVCEVSNARISDRLLRRWGWERHVEGSRRRHYIKRFYGIHPPPAEAWSLMAGERMEPEWPPPPTSDAHEQSRIGKAAGRRGGR